MVITMGHLAGQDLVPRVPALVVAAQILVIKVKVTMVVIINILVRAISNSIITQDIRVIQSSLMVANIMFSPQVCASEIRRFINEQ